MRAAPAVAWLGLLLAGSLAADAPGWGASGAPTLLLPGAAEAPGAVQGDVTCGGFAPVAPLSCTSGPWNALSDVLVVFSFPTCGGSLGQPQRFGSCYAGTLRATYDDGEHVLSWQCNVVLTSFVVVEQTCSGGGEVPTKPFVVRCGSDVFGTHLAGGLGEWACSMLAR